MPKSCHRRLVNDPLSKQCTKIFLLFHSAVVNNTPVKEKIKSFLLKEKCGPNRFNHGWKQIRTRGVAEKQEFTLKMYEKVWSRFNQGIM